MSLRISISNFACLFVLALTTVAKSVHALKPADTDALHDSSPVSIQTQSQSLALRALRLDGNRAKRKRLRLDGNRASPVPLEVTAAAAVQHTIKKI